MTTFDERDRAFEAKFARDEEMQFRAESRRNKLIGLWAAELLGKTGDEAQSYVQQVMKADFHEAGYEDVIRKLVGDLEGVADEARIRARLAELTLVAKEQLLNES
jgi:hypothetical protein